VTVVASGVLDESARRLAEKFCREEITVHRVYSWLAEKEKDPVRREHLRKLAEQELRHYEFWSWLLGSSCRPYGVTMKRIMLLYRLLGPVFTLRLLERGEEATIEQYQRFLDRIRDKQLRRELEQIIREEEEHEEALLSSIEDTRVKYMGFIALGLADAIVEITGVHAGFLGATSSTILAGVAGLVVGFSAALSMAGAAYLQAKHGRETRPAISAGVTGVSYIISVILLALPYFLLHTMLEAFAVSLVIATVIIAGFTYFSTVVQNGPFLREFLESTGLMLGTALGSYTFGKLLGGLLGVEAVL